MSLTPQVNGGGPHDVRIGTLPLTIGSNLLRAVVEKIIDLLQQVRFLAIRALATGRRFHVMPS